MSVLVRYPASQMFKGQYDAVRSALTEAGEWPPDGCQFHICYGPDNDMRVREVWESWAKYEAWSETLRPRTEEAGIEMGGEPEVFDVYTFETL